MSLIKDIAESPDTKPAVAGGAAKKPFGMIREFSVQAALKTSDGSDAGKYDVVDRATAGGDVGFNLMRNTINSSGSVTGSDVADYIERAEELNDEVETVPFGLETDDGKIVKVYVNAEQADKFEEAMKNMLGLEDDIEEAINRLTTEFDIVDVVWPKSDDADGDGEVDQDQDLEIDDTSNLDADDEDDFATDQYDVIAGGEADTPEVEPGTGKAKAAAEPAEPADGAEKTVDGGTEDEPTEDEPTEDEPDGGPDKPKKKKKKRKNSIENAPAPAAEGTTPDGPAVNEAHLDKHDTEADSPSQAAAIKLMTSKGLHIAAMVEHPGNVVYIEDSEGEEYVLRDDKKLTKEKHGKKLMSLKKEALTTTQEKDMTLGNRFLERVLGEAVDGEDRDGVKDGFNIPLDSQARAMAAKQKLPWAKRLIAFHFMCGVPGRYMNTPEVSEAVAGAADMLRKKVAVRRAFSTLYEGLAAAKGLTIKQDAVQEAKKTDANDKIAKAEAALEVAQEKLSKLLRSSNKPTQADKERVEKLKASRQEALDNLVKAKAEAKQITEATKQKRGSFIQKLLESVLIELGLPESLVVTTGPAAVGTGIYKTAELVEQDSTLERALRLLATRLGIKGQDAMKPVEESMNEAKKPKLPKDKSAAIEVTGVKGMKSTPWSKKFKDQAAMEAWMDKHGEDITVHAYSTDRVFEADARFSQLSALSGRTDEGKQSMGKGYDASVDAERVKAHNAAVKKDGRFVKSPHKLGKAPSGYKFDDKGLLVLKEDAVNEAVDVGNDQYAQAVTALVTALGVPDDILQRRRTQLITALREKKATLGNRAQVLMLMTRLQDLLAKNTQQNATPADDE